MFTGIIEEIGVVKKINWGRISASLTIDAVKILSDVKTGDSINTNGACLTVSKFGKKEFSVDVMAETMRRTNLKDLLPGSKVNLERALRLTDRLGGHMVSGHIDGTGKIIDFKNEENATWITISTEDQILKYIIMKGSVALDGVSLTVADMDKQSFKVSIIPHTAKETTLLQKKVNDIINIECDITAKYIEKFLLNKEDKIETSIDYKFLNKHGFTD